MRKKRNRIEIRVSELIFRKLAAIVSVSGKTRTALIEDLIEAEYEKNKKYRDKYYADLEKKMEDL